MSLYVGHLSSRTRRGELERVFQKFGRCDVRLKDGYGFIVYDYPPNAEKALRALQGRNICGEALTLTWSNKQPRGFKRFARADRSYDHEPVKVRSSARGEDYGNRQLDLNVQQDYRMSIEQPENHGVRLGSADLLNVEIDYNQDHVKEYTREYNDDSREDLLNEGGQVEPNLMDSDRWDGKHHDLSNGNDVEREMEFDRYMGYDRKDDDENHRIVYSSGSPPGQSPQEKIARELLGEGTLKHPNDSKALRACYSCGSLSHKKHNCPHEKTSGRYFTRFDRRHDNDIGRGGRGQGGLGSFGSNSRAQLQQDRDPSRAKQFKDVRKASGSGKHGRLIENGSSFIAKETDRVQEKEYGGKKRSRRRGGTPKRHSAKKARPNSSPLHSDYNGCISRTKSKSLKPVSRSISQSTSRSVSSRARTSYPNVRSSSKSHHLRSKSSRSSFPTSLSLSESLGRPLLSSPNKGQLKLTGTMDNSTTPESKDIMVGRKEQAEGDENANLPIEGAPLDVVNGESSSKADNEVEKDKAMQRGNGDNHMTPSSVPQNQNPSTQVSDKGALGTGRLSPESLRDKDKHDFDALTTEDVILPSTVTDSEPTSGRSTSISLDELCMVMKYYGLEPPDKNERHLSVEAYFGSARMWPWEIVYYRRLKKGPISTENYARRVEQNKEFGIVDKYIRSSSGWGELSHH